MALRGYLSQAMIWWHIFLLLHFVAKCNMLICMLALNDSITQYANTLNFQFDDIAALEPGMNLRANLQQTTGSYSAGAEHISHAQACIARGMGNYLREAVVNLVEVAA